MVNRISASGRGHSWEKLLPSANCLLLPVLLGCQTLGKQVEKNKSEILGTTAVTLICFAMLPVFISLSSLISPFTVLEENYKPEKALTGERSYKATGGTVHPCDDTGLEGQGHQRPTSGPC